MAINDGDIRFYGNLFNLVPIYFEITYTDCYMFQGYTVIFVEY